jgi:hypothetical protein
LSPVNVALRDGDAAFGRAPPSGGDFGCRLTPLFRLGSAQLIQDRVSFPIGGANQTPGVIVMAIDDRTGRDLERR